MQVGNSGGPRKKKKKWSPRQPANGRCEKNEEKKEWLSFLVGSGIFLVVLGSVFQYLTSNVSLEFIQPVGRAYEFQLKNNTPSDRVVQSFRVDLPQEQMVISKLTEDVYVKMDEEGKVILPGGNKTYVPAAEFKELDGQVVSANSSLKFRIPPLMSRSSMSTEALIVDVRYETRPSRHVLACIENILDFAGIHLGRQNVRYLVIENYWTISRSTSINEALRVYCRDKEEGSSSFCSEQQR